jgi:hypothetical protein
LRLNFGLAAQGQECCRLCLLGIEGELALRVIETETFPIEKVDLFFKTLV